MFIFVRIKISKGTNCPKITVENENSLDVSVFWVQKWYNHTVASMEIGTISCHGNVKNRSILAVKIRPQFIIVNSKIGTCRYWCFNDFKRATSEARKTEIHEEAVIKFRANELREINKLQRDKLVSYVSCSCSVI